MVRISTAERSSEADSSRLSGGTKGKAKGRGTGVGVALGVGAGAGVGRGTGVGAGTGAGVGVSIGVALGSGVLMGVRTADGLLPAGRGVALGVSFTTSPTELGVVLGAGVGPAGKTPTDPGVGGGETTTIVIEADVGLIAVLAAGGGDVGRSFALVALAPMLATPARTTRIISNPRRGRHPRRRAKGRCQGGGPFTSPGRALVARVLPQQMTPQQVERRID